MRDTPGRFVAFFETYTKGLTVDDMHRLFTRDTRDAYQFLTRGADLDAFKHLPWYSRAWAHVRLLFVKFTMKLSPARRVLYAVALLFAASGLFSLLRRVPSARMAAGAMTVIVPGIGFPKGAVSLVVGFALLNLLVLLEVADRLSLKNDLEIAREIQQAMLPKGAYATPAVEVLGVSRPANTVGGDFYDIIPLDEGRVVVAVGDVAGKGSPAALLMALLLAMLRTLVDERLEPAALMTRLNAQVIRHAPGTRFITLLYAVYDSASGVLTYVNAGHMPPLVLRRDGSCERLSDGGIALGMFDGSAYTPGFVTIDPDELLAIYSDGITEAENQHGVPFDEAGLESALRARRRDGLSSLGASIVRVVERYSADTRLADDLTILLLRRTVPAAMGLSYGTAMRTGRLFAALLTLVVLSDGRVPLAAQATATDGVTILLRRIEQIVLAGDTAQYLDILADSADRADAQNFARAEIVPGASRVTVKERDRGPLQGTLPGNGYQLSVDVFVEHGARARSATWQLEVKRSGDAWVIARQDRMAQVENLYRLSVNPAKQFDVRALTISVEDLDLTLAEGSAFVIETDQGTTGLVLLGKGEARFHPTPAVEKGQLRIFCGADVYQTRFDATYVRINPQDVTDLLDASRLVARPVDARELRRAEEVFREEAAKSYGVDMADMSRELWSITPPAGDFLAEIHTARHNTLTYARSRVEPEDISFFDRKGHRNIAVYSSKEARERFGWSYNEDDFVSYDVLGYDIDLAVSPDRSWLEGRARLQIRVLATAINSISLRLAESLTVQSIFSQQFGRLLGVRVRNQNTIIINLPSVLLRDDDLVLTVVYAGRLEPQHEDTEALAAQGAGRPTSQGQVDDMPVFQPERNFLYSNRSYWYPQAMVTDYATASLRLTVPANIDCIASGMLDAGFPAAVASADAAPARKVYLFTTAQPLRYLAFVLSRFTRGEVVEVAAGVDSSVTLSVQTNPRQARRGRELGERASDILGFYGSILGEAPYPTFTLAVIESELPGGHSPGYFAALNQPLPTSPYVWRNDPASFEDFPEFFIAHEIAHQWWGQAVGWRNYHEQWLSEGFAQYFAALYAQRRRGDETFTSVLRQFRRWGMQQSDQGPIYLGYRLGHIRGDSRVLRAVVYNKSAAVLHMLRRLVGDEQFFLGVRRFYTALRFKKAGTEDFREAMEMETGRSLERFFEKWIYGSTLPRLKVGYRVEAGPSGQQAVIHVEQLGEVFDLPLTVTLEYADKKTVEVVVPVTDRLVDFPVPLTGLLRSVAFGRDEGTLAEIVKG